MIPRKLVALATGLAALLLSTATLAQDQSILNKVLDSGTLRVGTTGDFNPMSFKDPETKEYMGHQIDAAKQLATDMGVEVEFVPTDWKTLINGVVAGKYDIVMTGTSMTVTRAKAAGYTIPWGRTGYLPLTRGEIADRFKSWDDINQPDVTVGYNLGTSFADFVKLRLPNAKVKEVESPARDWQELLAGRVDVTVSSILEAGKLSSTHETLAIPFQKVANSLPLSFIAPQSDHVWLGFLNNWMRIKHE
ncbi:MAG: transporter substrate-binding domain-containing protein, partial [Gammaproteobacteria bacterium]|nr:transporter substrate-binding domain-containing protein [Gammaproteobacteria bacterium]